MTILAAADGGVDTRVQVVALIVTAIMLGVVLELVRRRRLAERYALLWMLVAATLLVLAVWKGLLADISHLVGIAIPANALFLAAFGVVFLLLLHFSVATSRLGEETKILAQEVARLDHELRTRSANGSGPDRAERPAVQSGAKQREDRPPVRAKE
jgi:hypothetical protein